MQKKMTSVLTAAAAVTAMFATMAAQAVPPHLPDLVKGGNRWLITFYDDSSVTHNQWATQGLCFFQVGTAGTHTRYVWYSDTFPDWNGRATQEGDQVFMHGDYAADVGHDGMEWELVTMSYKDEGGGHWKEWREDGGFGRTIGWGNAKLTRVGDCRYIDTTSPDETGKIEEVKRYSSEYVNVEFPRAVTGESIVVPNGDGLTNDINSVIEAR